MDLTHTTRAATPDHICQLFPSLPRRLNHACQNPGEGSLTANSQRTRRRHPIQHPPTPTPSVASRNSNYRCKAVHSLPVSTTSYFRHVVSTVQTRSARPTTVRSLIDTGGGYIPSIPYPKPKSSPPGLHFSFPIDSFSSNFARSNKVLYLASDRNHSTSTES